MSNVDSIPLCGKLPRGVQVSTRDSTSEHQIDAMSRKESVSAKRQNRRKASWQKRRALKSFSTDIPSKCCEAQLYTLVNGVNGDVTGGISLNVLPDPKELVEMRGMSGGEFGKSVKAGDITKVVAIRPDEELNSSSVMDDSVLEDTKRALSARSGSAILKNANDPYYPLLKKFEDVVSKDPPMRLPSDRGVRHEIDLVPGAKYCVTRQ